MRIRKSKSKKYDLFILASLCSFQFVMTPYFFVINRISRGVEQIRDILDSSARIEYVVKEGDSLDSLRSEFFYIGPNEFKHLDSKIFAQNRGFGNKGYKELVADNLWTEEVRKENNLSYWDVFKNGMYSVGVGEKLKIPVRDIE